MNAKGTGLGLSICKNLIEQMGGNVTVESNEGQGTKFIITIGLKAEEKDESKIQTTSIESENKNLDFTPDFSQKFTCS